MASELMDIRVVGVGGAGINVLDRLVLDGARSESLVALHADLRSLNGSVAPHKIQLGRRTTRGLGSGGDPELGRVAAEEALAEFKEAIAGAELVFLCVGLGGGTGSGGAPLFARAAKAQGANVLVFATLPFSFEGSRRARQAHDAWRALRDEADAVICFENDRMGENLSPEASIHEAFADADRTISQSILSIGSMVSHESLIQLGFDEVLAALKGDEGRCIFGFGSAAGESRAHDALALALRNPLMDRGRMLEESERIVVQVTGGRTLTLWEVQLLMEELGRALNERTHVMFGVSVREDLGDSMSVMIFSCVRSLPGRTRADAEAPARRETDAAPASRTPTKPAVPSDRESDPTPAAGPPAPKRPRISAPTIFTRSTSSSRSSPAPPARTPPASFPETILAPPDDEAPAPPEDEELEHRRHEQDEAWFEHEKTSSAAATMAGEDASTGPERNPPPKEIPEAPANTPAESEPARAAASRSGTRHASRSVPPGEGQKKENAPAPVGTAKTKGPQQGMLNLEPANRGRFEKSEPTIIDGENLDVPTYLRQGMGERDA